MYTNRIICKVELSHDAEKDLRKIPKYVRKLFLEWVEVIEYNGLKIMQEMKGYRDHGLKGNRLGQRSVSLTRCWRVIYETDEKCIHIIVLEVNHHDY